MKRLLLTALICAVTTLAFAQDTKNDSVKVYNKQKQDFIKMSRSDYRNWKDSVKRDIREKWDKKGSASGFKFDLTFSRFDLGLTTLIDNGSFTLSPQNDFLSYRSWKSSNVGFDLVEMGYRFNKNFKVYVSGGFDWTLLRLRKDITIQKDAPTLTYTTDAIDYSKNRFSSTYLRIPLSFEFRSAENHNGKRVRFIVGPEAGLLLGGKVKQISDENGKQKFTDDYHFAKMRYGAFARLGYGGGGIFAKYYFNDMFENSPAQAGLKNFAFGFTFGF